MRVDPRSFDDIYGASDDPWGFTSSPYEVAKYDVTVASLGAARYDRCFEPACSIGALTGRLASRADSVVACDASPIAIKRASTRLGELDHVELVAAVIPEWWPTGTFDLVVLSELGYYWDLDGWRDIIRRCRTSLRHGGEVIAVHWLGSSPDHVLDGAAVHRELIAQFGPADLHVDGGNQEPMAQSFVLDRWTGVRRD